MSNISFKRFIEIVESLDEDGQINEGQIFDFLKKKLGIAPTAAQVQAEIDRLKTLNASDLKKIKASAASKEFHKRRAAMKPTPTGAKPIQRPSSIDYKSAPELNAPSARAAELKWAKEQ